MTDATTHFIGVPDVAEPTRYRVLVVDDNVDSAQSMSLLLQLEGHTVACAHDGIEALQMAEQFQPQVVLLDLGLPRMNGYDVARKLREAPADGAQSSSPRPLLVAISGYGREQDRAAAQQAGFDFHLTKPADPDAVMRLMQEHGPRQP